MFRHQFLSAFAAAVFSCSALAQDKVVYHFGEGLAQAGVARITQLQSREGYAYLKP